MWAIFFMNFSKILADFQAGGFPRLVFIRKCWIIDGPLSMLPKIPTYTFINFQEIFPSIRLFSNIFLLVFVEISHLYVYSDSSSIRNSRVGFSGTLRSLFVILLRQYFFSLCINYDFPSRPEKSGSCIDWRILQKFHTW